MTGPVGGEAAPEQQPLDPRRFVTTLEQARIAAQDFVGAKLINGSTGMAAVVSNNTLRKMLSESAVHKSNSAPSHAMAVANLDLCFSAAVLVESGPDRRADVNLLAIHRFAALLRIGDEALAVKMTVKEFAQSSEGNRIYSWRR